MSQYKTGTASVTNGNQVVTGTGTAWLSNVQPGDGFTVAGTGVTYDVAGVDSDTQLTLTANYAGASVTAASYAVFRDFTANANLPELSQGDIETAALWTRALRRIDKVLFDYVHGLANHEAAPDPHAQYTTEGEAAAAAPVQSVDNQTGDVDLSSRYEAKRKNNLSATTDPTANDDAADGYEPLSRWINTTTAEIWLCVDATQGAADWQQASLTLDELGSAALANTSDFDSAGTADSAVSAHEADPDPHEQYSQLSGGADADFTAMPQVGGDPIVESGSNSDGEWTRWADGTQMCRSEEFFNTDVVSAAGALFYTGSSYQFSPYPLAFIAPPSVNIDIRGRHNAIKGGFRSVLATTDSPPTFYHLSDSDRTTSDDYQYQYTAFGYWK